MKPDLLQRITIEPGKCGGRPCIRGLRIRVQDILDMLAAGASEEEILRDAPYLERDNSRATITYAAAYLDHTIMQAQTARHFSWTPTSRQASLVGCANTDTMPSTSTIALA